MELEPFEPHSAARSRLPEEARQLARRDAELSPQARGVGRHADARADLASPGGGPFEPFEFPEAVEKDRDAIRILRGEAQLRFGLPGAAEDDVARAETEGGFEFRRAGRVEPEPGVEKDFEQAGAGVALHREEERAVRKRRHERPAKGVRPRPQRVRVQQPGRPVRRDREEALALREVSAHEPFEIRVGKPHPPTSALQSDASSAACPSGSPSSSRATAHPRIRES